jgi:hypothetical protein
MAGDDDLRINTLHRFAKHSPRLVLHEYSHCEVPAGCGGVVLRWIDPVKGEPVMVRLMVSDAEASCWLDGEPVPSQIALLPAGRRVLAVHLRREKPGAQPFTVGIFRDDDFDTDLIRLGGPRWRCATAPPGVDDGWTAPGFDDAAWREAPLASAALLAAQSSWQQRAFENAASAGQPVFALDADELWLRVAFMAPGAR